MLALLNKLMYTLICCDGYDTVNNKYGPLAHLVEHLTLNQGVQGSSPWRRTQRYRFYGRMSHRVGAFLLHNFWVV